MTFRAFIAGLIVLALASSLAIAEEKPKTDGAKNGPPPMLVTLVTSCGFFLAMS